MNTETVSRFRKTQIWGGRNHFGKFQRIITNVFVEGSVTWIEYLQGGQFLQFGRCTYVEFSDWVFYNDAVLDSVSIELPDNTNFLTDADVTRYVLKKYSQHDFWFPLPTDAMRKDPRFDAIMEAIKTWSIGVPEAYVGYCDATGNHVASILKGLDALKMEPAKIQLKAEQYWSQNFNTKIIISITEDRVTSAYITESGDRGIVKEGLDEFYKWVETYGAVLFE